MNTTAAPELIGKELKQTPFEVTTDAILKFGAGIGDETPQSTDPERTDFRAHPMFAATSIIPGTGVVVFQPGIAIDVNKIVHGGIKLSFGEPVKPGDTIGTIAALLEIAEKSSGKLINIQFDTRNQHGSVVASGITRYFSRGKQKSPGTENAAKRSTLEPEQTLTVPTRTNQSLLYAAGSGDRFPIHTDDNFAKSVGLPGKIMHGMCTLAMSLNAVLDHMAEGKLNHLEEVECRFSHIVLPGATLSVHIRVTDHGIRFETHDDEGHIAIDEGRIKLAAHN